MEDSADFLGTRAAIHTACQWPSQVLARATSTARCGVTQPRTMPRPPSASLRLEVCLGDVDLVEPLSISPAVPSPIILWRNLRLCW